jgi:hypothetical protein
MTLPHRVNFEQFCERIEEVLNSHPENETAPVQESVDFYSKQGARRNYTGA